MYVYVDNMSTWETYESFVLNKIVGFEDAK